MRHYNHNDFVSSIDLQSPELHDFRNLPTTRPNRVLVAALVLAAVLTAGHFMDRTGRQTTETRAAVVTVATQG